MSESTLGDEDKPGLAPSDVQISAAEAQTSEAEDHVALPSGKHPGGAPKSPAKSAESAVPDGAALIEDASAAAAEALASLESSAVGGGLGASATSPTDAASRRSDAAASASGKRQRKPSARALEALNWERDEPEQPEAGADSTDSAAAAEPEPSAAALESAGASEKPPGKKRGRKPKARADEDGETLPEAASEPMSGIVDLQPAASDSLAGPDSPTITPADLDDGVGDEFDSPPRDASGRPGRRVSAKARTAAEVGTASGPEADLEDLDYIEDEPPAAPPGPQADVPAPVVAPTGDQVVAVLPPPPPPPPEAVPVALGTASEVPAPATTPAAEPLQAVVPGSTLIALGPISDPAGLLVANGTGAAEALNRPAVPYKPKFRRPPDFLVSLNEVRAAAPPPRPKLSVIEKPRRGHASDDEDYEVDDIGPDYKKKAGKRRGESPTRGGAKKPKKGEPIKTNKKTPPRPLDHGAEEAAAQLQSSLPEGRRLRGITVRVDSGAPFPLPVTHKVYHDQNGIYDCRLEHRQHASNGQRFRHFYIIQLLQTHNRFATWKRWGTVGDPQTPLSQTQLTRHPSLAAAVKDFERKYKEKTGNLWKDRNNFEPRRLMYTLMERPQSSYVEEPAAEEYSGPASRLHPSTQRLIALMFDTITFQLTLRQNNVDVDSLPLDNLNTDQIASAAKVLDTAIGALQKGETPDLVALSHSFAAAVPLDNPTRRGAGFFTSLEDVCATRCDVVEVLSSIDVAQRVLKAELPVAEPLHPLDVKYLKLGVAIDAVERDSDEWRRLETYYVNTNAAFAAKRPVTGVYRLRRPGDAERSAPFQSLTNRKLLWSGCHTTEVAAVLTQGLDARPHRSGYRALEFFDAAEAAEVKPTEDPIDGETVAFHFLSEVALGASHLFQERATAPGQPTPAKRPPPPSEAPAGFDSVVLQGQLEPDRNNDLIMQNESGYVVVVPQGPMMQAAAQTTSARHTSYIIYKPGQAQMRYLIRTQHN